MEDRFRFRGWYYNPYNEKDCCNNQMFYDVQDTYDYMGGSPAVMANCFGSVLDDDNWTIEQCTGIKDKSGTLIYEGDIIYPCYVVKRQFNGYMLPTGKQLDFYNGTCEIIGNIHTNPELMKG